MTSFDDPDDACAGAAATAPGEVPNSMITRIVEDRASRTLGIKFLGMDAARFISFGQAIDERRLVDGPVIADLGVLIDAAAGSAAYAAAADPERTYVVSHLAVSIAPRTTASRHQPTDTETPQTPSSGAPLTGTGDRTLVARSGPPTFGEHGTVLATAEVHFGGDRIATAICRSIEVRPPHVAAGGSASPVTTPTGVTQHDGATDPLVGNAPMGLTADQATDDGGISWTPQPWMSNGLGSVQGGVIVSCAAQVAAAAADAGIGSGDTGRRLLDLSLEIMKSPRIGGSDYRWSSDVVRRGRRLTVIASSLRDAEGALYAMATATVLAPD